MDLKNNYVLVFLRIKDWIKMLGNNYCYFLYNVILKENNCLLYSYLN